jgi:hypothetical protein
LAGESSFKYAGNVINTGKGRTQTGNGDYPANVSTVIRTVMSAAAKIQVYRTLTWPVATYGGTYMNTNITRECTENVREKSNTQNIRTSDGK